MKETFFLTNDDIDRFPLFLRFTDSIEDDMKYRRSLWIQPAFQVEENHDFAQWEEGVDYIRLDDDMIGVFHDGLSGHVLKSETIEDAIKEVEAGTWFYKLDRSWAIYEVDGRLAHGDTPEGDTFSPSRVIYYRENKGHE